MTIFSNLKTAQTHGFYWVEFRPDLGVHLVERVFTQGDGQMMRAMAFAKPDPPEKSPTPEPCCC